MTKASPQHCINASQEEVEDVALSATPPAIQMQNLSYGYPSRSLRQTPLVLQNLSLTIKSGSRVLIVGRNGAGKSTLLSILGGNKLIPEETAHILGRPAFHDIFLRKDVLYLGDHWKSEYCADISVKQMLGAHLDTPRFKKLVKLLDVDLDWSISRVSDGQRRRCQLLANLLNPRKVYLLDEVTTDLDLLARDGLMQFLKLESEKQNATILYATHIFDGMEGWATHLLYLQNGKVFCFDKIHSIARYQELLESGCITPLYLLIREWFLSETQNFVNNIN